jgi:hypothetical protein
MYSRLLVHAFEADIVEDWAENVNVTTEGLLAKSKEVTFTISITLIWLLEK